MNWTTATPEIHGWYWWKVWATSQPVIIHVFSQGPFWAATCGPVPINVALLGGLWAGPIEEPEWHP